MLNVAAAAGVWPYVFGGRPVAVIIRRCPSSGGARACRGDYRLAGVTHLDQRVLGADTAAIGSRLRATVGVHAGAAMVGHPAWSLAEAAALALAGAVLAVWSLRAGWRSRRRRRDRQPVPAVAVPPPGQEADDADDAGDPLAGVRRRRFGAGG